MDVIMKKSIVFMYSGQGSHYYNMGKDLYESNLVFKKNMDYLNEVFEDTTGKSLVDELYVTGKKARESFDNILYTHSAIFATEYSITQVLMKAGVEPDFLLGSSLGEFVAGALAGVMSAEEMLKNLIKQAQILQNKCPEGGMLAIVDKYNSFFENPLIHSNSEIASINFDTHFVVSGSQQALEEIQKYLDKKEIIALRLPVNYPFHSSLIEPIASEYREYLGTLKYNKPSINMISCMTEDKVESVDSSFYWNVARKPMNFINTIKKLESEHDCLFLDLGPSGTSANFTKNNISRDKLKSIYTIISPFGNNTRNLDRLYKDIF